MRMEIKGDKCASNETAARKRLYGILIQPPWKGIYEETCHTQRKKAKALEKRGLKLSRIQV